MAFVVDGSRSASNREVSVAVFADRFEGWRNYRFSLSSKIAVASQIQWLQRTANVHYDATVIQRFRSYHHNSTQPQLPSSLALWLNIRVSVQIRAYYLHSHPFFPAAVFV
ncbi:hypothetical protein M407DRAFT_26822 [Tulasnella calospora MUT 4182]|uniref:Uncharacterized protein n=1 Tax=Tulasnella calospora MUT 4182 TaxID=1051891 RepID=A0A0C3QF29_9AGAM|nr:hypothetical protein M407DRAFT_26822 [Tulasnella calospora MUT 4182]